MKKILLVTRPICPPWDEASKNFAYYLAKNIKGVEIHLLTNSNCKLSDLPENIYQEPVYTAASFDFNQKMKSLFYQILFRKSYDIIHYCFTPAKLNAFFIKNFIKNKKAKTIQTVATLREDLYSEEDLKKILFADLIVTYSDYSKNKLEGLGFKNTRRIYPGIDVDIFSPAPKNLEFMKKFGFLPDDFVINFAGEYTRLGAIDDVINSFVEVSKKIPNAKLSLAVRIKNGRDAQKKKEVMETLKKNNVFDRVAFHDDGNYQMRDIFNLCDLSLFPVQNMHGKFDVPLAVLEAMACQKPVIISDIPILKEFANSQNSVTIEAGKTEQLAQAIEDLYLDRNKCQTIGENARKFAQDYFDIKKIGEKYKEVYESL